MIAAHREELAWLDAVDSGNPLRAERAEIDQCAEAGDNQRTALVLLQVTDGCERQ